MTFFGKWNGFFVKKRVFNFFSWKWDTLIVYIQYPNVSYASTWMCSVKINWEKKIRWWWCFLLNNNLPAWLTFRKVFLASFFFFLFYFSSIKSFCWRILLFKRRRRNPSGAIQHSRINIGRVRHGHLAEFDTAKQIIKFTSLLQQSPSGCCVWKLCRANGLISKFQQKLFLKTENSHTQVSSKIVLF